MGNTLINQKVFDVVNVIRNLLPHNTGKTLQPVVSMIYFSTRTVVVELQYVSQEQLQSYRSTSSIST